MSDLDDARLWAYRAGQQQARADLLAGVLQRLSEGGDLSNRDQIIVDEWLEADRNARAEDAEQRQHP